MKSNRTILTISSFFHFHDARVTKIDGKRLAPKGRLKTERTFRLIQTILSKFFKIKEDRPDEFDEEFEAMKARVTDTYKETRVDELRDGFRRSLNTKHRPSAAEMQSGISVSPKVQGLLQLGKLFGKAVEGVDNKNKELLETEAKGRLEAQRQSGMNIDEYENKLATLTNMTKCKHYIKEHETQRKGGGMRHDDRYFEPLFTSAAEYYSAQSRSV